MRQAFLYVSHFLRSVLLFRKMSFKLQRVIPVAAHAGIFFKVVGSSSGVIGHGIAESLGIKAYAGAPVFLTKLPFSITCGLA